MVIGLDYKWVQKTFWHYKKQYLKSQDKNIDSDVADENERVHKMNEEDISDHYLVLKDFTKYYGKVLAVNQICLKVNKYKVFSLSIESSFYFIIIFKEVNVLDFLVLMVLAKLLSSRC